MFFFVLGVLDQVTLIIFLLVFDKYKTAKTEIYE
jgi:hypothetical protein